MIKPILQDKAFLADIHSASADRLHIWWLGQSGYLLKWKTSHLLIDPYLSDSLTKKYAGTDKPHVRLTEQVIAPEQLDFIDCVTSSHNHTDHLDGETLIPLIQANPAITVIVPRANVNFAADRLKINPKKLTPIITGAQSLKVGPYTFHAVPSAHQELETDENGDQRFIGFMIEVGGRTIYHSGDNCPYEGLVTNLSKWRIDLALLPINGRDPARRVPGNFTASEAVQLGRQIRAGLVIPCHYEMFEFNTVSPEGFVLHAQTNGVPYHILRCGERLDL